jgi:hypothetical protein
MPLWFLRVGRGALRPCPASTPQAAAAGPLPPLRVQPHGTLVAAYRVQRGRCKPGIRDLKDTGLAHLPAAGFADRGGPPGVTSGIGSSGTLRGATPARLRDTLLPVAGRLIRTRRRAVVRWGSPGRGAARP